VISHVTHRLIEGYLIAANWAAICQRHYPIDSSVSCFTQVRPARGWRRE
jgi:hypothetical protein